MTLTTKFIKPIILIFWLAFAFMAACTPTDLLVETQPAPQTATSTAVSSPTATIMPTQTSIPTLTPIIAQTPPFGAMSNEVEGWYIYHNKTHDYRFSYAPIATPTLYSEDCVRVELYDSGFLLITATSTALSAGTAATLLPPACQPPPFAADQEPEMIRLAGETVMAEKQAGPTYRVTLPNGLQIDYGLLPDVDPQAIDSQAALAVMGDMLDSLRFTGEVALALVTPTPIAAGCLDDTPPVSQPPAGKLRVVYELDGQTWEWREETGTSALSVAEGAVPLSPDPLTAREEGLLSANGGFQVSLRQPDETSYELWLSDADGGNQRLLLSLSSDELYERYPEFLAQVGLNFGWIADTSLISYRFSPEFNALGEPPLQTMGIVDAETGDTWTVLPPELAWAYQFSKDGRQLFAITDEGIQIINTLDGTVGLDIPLDIVAPYEQGITFTPDGSRIFVYTDAGLALVNPDDGTFSEIPLDYVPIGAGHYSILPPVYWLEDETQFYTVTTTDEVWGNPEATFTVWLVDTAAASATPLNTFTGFYMSAVLSPDQRWLTFYTQKMDNTRKLYLADVNTGEQFLYDNLHLLEFIGWSPDGTQFLYRSFDTNQPILGHICAKPQALSGFEVGFTDNTRWVDTQRLLVVGGMPERNQPRPLRLVSLDGQNILIATLKEDYPVFRFYFEE